jgi:hypothetical protein
MYNAPMKKKAPKIKTPKKPAPKKPSKAAMLAI